MHQEPIGEPTTAAETGTNEPDGEGLTAAAILNIPTKETSAEDSDAEPLDIPEDDSDADSEEEEEENDLETLDPELAQSPELRKRWDERMRGVDKLVERNKAQSEALGTWTQIAEALEHPETAFEVYEAIGHALAKLHGEGQSDYAAPEYELYDDAQDNTQQSGDAQPYDDTDWEALGFDDEEDYGAFRNAADAIYAPVINTLWQEIQALKGDVEGSRAERAQTEQAHRYHAWISQVAPQVVEQAAQGDQGWKITPDMVDQAVRTFPHLASNPIEAVYARYPKELKSHYASLNRRGSPRGPELNTETSRNAGTPWPDDPENLTAAQILSARGG